MLATCGELKYLLRYPCSVERVNLVSPIIIDQPNFTLKWTASRVFLKGI